MSLKVKAHFVQAHVRTVEYRVYYYPLAQLRWRRGYSIWFVRPSVRLSRTKCVHFSSKGIKLWTLKPMLIYSLHIGVVSLVFYNRVRSDPWIPGKSLNLPNTFKDNGISWNSAKYPGKSWNFTSKCPGKSWNWTSDYRYETLYLVSPKIDLLDQIWGQRPAKGSLVCASPLKGKWYRFRILCGFTPDIL